MVLPWRRRIERSSIEESNDFGIRVMTVQYKIMTSSHRPRGFAPSRVGLLLDIVCHLSAVAVQYIGSLFNLDMHSQSLKVPNQKHVCNHQLFDWGLWRLLSHETSCIKHWFDFNPDVLFYGKQVCIIFVPKPAHNRSKYFCSMQRTKTVRVLTAALHAMR